MTSESKISAKISPHFELKLHKKLDRFDFRKYPTLFIKRRSFLVLVLIKNRGETKYFPKFADIISEVNVRDKLARFSLSNVAHFVRQTHQLIWLLSCINE